MKTSFLWGTIGLLGFLVLLQGYELVSGYRYDLTIKFAVAVGVAVGATGLSYLADERLFE